MNFNFYKFLLIAIFMSRGTHAYAADVDHMMDLHVDARGIPRYFTMTREERAVLPEEPSSEKTISLPTRLFVIAPSRANIETACIGMLTDYHAQTLTSDQADAERKLGRVLDGYTSFILKEGDTRDLAVALGFFGTMGISSYAAIRCGKYLLGLGQPFGATGSTLGMIALGVVLTCGITYGTTLGLKSWYANKALRDMQGYCTEHVNPAYVAVENSIRQDYVDNADFPLTDNQMRAAFPAREKLKGTYRAWIMPQLTKDWRKAYSNTKVSIAVSKAGGVKGIIPGDFEGRITDKFMENSNLLIPYYVKP